MGASQDRYRDKNLTNHNAIQACAAEILENMHKGITGPPKGHSPGRVRSAYKLLLFEGLISRRQEIVLNDRGKRHIDSHGYTVYPIDNAKNPR